MIQPIILLSFLLVLQSINQSVNAQLTRPQLITKLIGSGSGYDDTLRPLIGTGQPVEVELDYRIDLLYSVSSADEQFSLAFFMSEKWLDPRLTFDNSLFPLPHGDSLRLPISGVWKPDTYFYNSVKCSTSDSVLKLDASGEVAWTRHMTCTFYTPFDLSSFPFDSQGFPIQRLSFAYNASELVYSFSDLGCFQPDPRLDFSNALWNLQTTGCTFDQYPGGETLLSAELFTERLFGNYVLKMILPLFLLVLVSSLSYFVDPAIAPARIGLSVTIVLSVTTFNILVSSDLPKINYSTLLDWYVWMCFMFVILAVGEFSVVNHLLHSKVWPPRVARLVDDFFQWTVPIVWGLANLIFWPIVDVASDAVFGAMILGWIVLNIYRMWWCYRNEKDGMIMPMIALFWFIKHRLDDADRKARETYEDNLRRLKRIGGIDDKPKRRKRRVRTLPTSTRDAHFEPINQSANQSVNQSDNQSINHSDDHSDSDDELKLDESDEIELGSINQSMNQSINQSTNQLLDSDRHESALGSDLMLDNDIDQSINQSISQPIGQSISHAISQPINQPINQSVDDSINPSSDSPRVYIPARFGDRTPEQFHSPSSGGMP